MCSQCRGVVCLSGCCTVPVTFNIDINDSSKKSFHSRDFSTKSTLDKIVLWSYASKKTLLRPRGHLAWHFIYLEPSSLTPKTRVIASKFPLAEFLPGLRGQSQRVFERLLPDPGPVQAVANCQQLKSISNPRPLPKSRHWPPLFS